MIALVRRGDEVLLVQQQGPNDPGPTWALPGGMVESGELLTEALVREVREETGLKVVQIGSFVYVLQLDCPAYQPLNEAEANPATVFALEVIEWEGDLDPADPDSLILEARFLPLADAVRKLEKATYIPIMGGPMAAYLRGEVSRGAAWFYRRQPDGSDRLIQWLGNAGG